MKGSNSRFSHRPTQRYSNSAHIQGGMVTDADLTEAGQLHQARDEAQNALAFRYGVPAVDGAVGFVAGTPELRQGWIVAQSKQGRLTGPNGVTGADLFATQADLLNGPALPDGRALLYADLWERPVFALQDPYLADPGLHGAETSYRTRTMTQIKALPLTGGTTLDTALAALAGGTGVFRRTGTALVSVTPKNTEIAVDSCDPCADQVDIVPTVPNALFRLEVVEVLRSPQGVPTQARFAWSMENAAVLESMARLQDVDTGLAIKSAFARDGAVYEYLSEATEAQIGRFSAGVVPVAPVFLDSLTENAATHVRRWDGCALVNLTNSTVPAAQSLGQGTMTAAAGKAELTVEAFSVTIAFAQKELLAGDYWLIELRRFAPEVERIRLIGGAANTDALPVGPVHHFCPLFEVQDGVGLAPTDAHHRRLSFPALSDIPATHVGFAPDCPDFFDNAQNVAQALNALCDLDATQVGFNPPADCERFAGTKTVDEALKRLCSVQDDTALTRVLRVMMDWGVVCGVRPRLLDGGSTRIAWTAGTMLDRTGRLVEVKAGEFDLRDLPDRQVLMPLDQIMEKDGEICLSFAAGADGALDIFLSDRATAFGPTDRTFAEAVEACVAGRKRVDFGDILRPLKPEETGIIKKLADVWANRRTLDGKVPLTLEEERVSKAFNETLIADYISKAEPARQSEIQTLLALAQETYNPDAVRGTVRDVRRMQLEATKFGIIATAEEEDRVACECANALTPCPPNPGKFGALVPVACLKPVRTTPQVSPFSELCVFCCRKQAMTWRAERYFNGSLFDSAFARLKDQCCTPKPKPGIDFGGWVDDWVTGIYTPKPKDPPVFDIPRDPIWPPIYRPGGKLPYGPDIVLAGPDIPGKYFNPKPTIDRLPPDQATTVLTGNGFDVLDSIDLDDNADPLMALGQFGANTETVLGRDAPEPGDKVVMLTRGGKAVDYVVVQKGSGKLPFETEAETRTRVEKVVKDLGIGGTAPRTPSPQPTPTDTSGLESKLKELAAQREATAADITRLEALRGQLAADIGGLETKMTDIGTQRQAFAADIEKSRQELAQIETLKQSNLDAIASASLALEAVKKDHAEFVLAMRRDQPIEAVLGANKEAVAALKANGIVTVSDLQASDATTMTRTLRGLGVTGSEAKTLANNFVIRR